VVTSCSRIGGQRGAVVLPGDHRVQLAAQRGLHRGVRSNPLDRTLQVAAVQATVFPSHHGGFLGGEFGYPGQPEAFARRLRDVLDDGN
jgi:hypothetical protein